MSTGLLLIALLLLPAAVSAGAWTGGVPLTTVQTGTVTGDLWFDASPPTWANQGVSNIEKTFTLPAAAVAEPGRIRWARLYIAAYDYNMQNDYFFNCTNRWDGDGDGQYTGTYDRVWWEPNHTAFIYLVNGGNDNSAFPGHGTGEPYKMINDHENRVSSDYFMWYDVKDLIHNQTVRVNVNTVGSQDGRVKIATLVVAYDDPDSANLTRYWVNEGHDQLTYYTEKGYGYVDIGKTTFATKGIGPFTSAVLTVNHMASNDGSYGFPSEEHNEDARVPELTWTNEALPAGYDVVQGAYSGVVHWDVTSLMKDYDSNVVLAYCRDFHPEVHTAPPGFYKAALAFLVVKSPRAPSANFTANVTDGTAPLAVQFNDTSRAGIPATWVWSFGDGNTSALRNPSHIYSVPGNFTVTLTAGNEAGSDIATKTGYINVTSPQSLELAASFTNITPREGTASLTVQFRDISTGSPTTWNWTFGDIGAGNTSTLQNPSHIYTTPGSYSVNLTVTGTGGTNMTVKTGFVKVLSASGAPVAAFSALPASGTAPLAVQFTDLSAGSPVSWAWDFDNDGKTDNTTQNASYTYVSAGTYTVKLTVTNPSGSDDEVKTGYVTAYPQPVISILPSTKSVSIGGTQDYQIVMDRAPAGLAGYNMNISLANPGIAEITGVSYPSWAQMTLTPAVPGQLVTLRALDNNLLVNTGDTNIVLATITVRGISDGKTPIGMVLREMSADGGGPYITPSAINTGTVVVGSYAGPVAAFTANATSGPANLTVQFTDQSLNSPTSWAWDFNNDGVTDSTGQNPSTTYTGTGSYSVNLTVTKSTVSDSHTEFNYITVTSGTVSPPVAGFTNSTPLSGVAPLTVGFTDKSTNAPVSWKWEYKNSTVSWVQFAGSQNPSCTFTAAGTYDIRLTATNAGGSGNRTQEGYISVRANARVPVASLNANVTYGKVPLVVQFTDTTPGTVTSRVWNFGDGTTSTSKAPIKTYTSAGINTVTLTVSNDDGLDTTRTTITANTADGIPGVAFSGTPTTGTAPLTVVFTDASSDSPTSWEWDFDDDGITDSTDKNPSYTFSTTGTYDVKLTARNAAGPGYLTKSSYISVTSSSTPSDLSITVIVPNPGSISGGTVFALEQNPVTLRIKNSGTGASGATTVRLHSGDGFSGTATVPEIASGGQTDVSITDTTIRQTAGSSTNIQYTATIDPDNLVSESSESNNVLTDTFSLRYNGYKGKRYWSGGNDIITRQTYDLHGGIAYSSGDSEYVSGGSGAQGWLSYTVNWQSTEPALPSGAKVRNAYLYVPYTWDSENIAPDNTFIDFNGQRVSRLSWNYDKSNFGTYADYTYGLLKYDVTSLYNKNEANSAVFTRKNPNISDPAQAAVYTKISMYEFFLVVVYEDDDSTRKQIFINDNFDLLGASTEYGTTSPEATAYVPFTGMTIDTANMDSATLTTFVPSGDSNEGNILYNGNVIASNVWSWGGSGTGVDGGKQVAIDTRDVTSHIMSSGNVFGIQSTDKGGTPCMAAIQQFLVVDLGNSATTTTTSTTTTTKTTIETIATYKGGPTVTLSSGTGSSGGGGGGGSGSGTGSPGSGGNGAGNSGSTSSGQQGSRYQAGPVEKSDVLDGENPADSTGNPFGGIPLGYLLSGIFLIGGTCIVAYRQGRFPAGLLPGNKGGQCIWDGTAPSCQTFDIENGIIRYRAPGTLNISRTHLILAGLIVSGILAAGAIWYLGFIPAGSSDPLSSPENVQKDNFDLIPTIEDIQDLDLTNRAPDYPPGFSARNGILFVYHGTDKHPLSSLELELSKGTSKVRITSSTMPPATNVVNSQLVSYFEEMGNGDGILDPGEWLMVYADNCYDSSQAEGEPKGKVLVWQPQDTVSALEVPLKDSVGYSLKDSSDGTILQQGTILLVPTTT